MAPNATHPEPGEAFPQEPDLAGLWSSTLQSLVARGAHDVNNALNGALMNVEVVRARARNGVDAGTLAPFAEAAASELESVARQSEALLALSRPPRTPLDAHTVLRHAAALLELSAARAGIVLELAGDRACPTGGDTTAVRVAIVAGLLATVDALRGSTDETAGPVSAHEPARHLRCTTRADGRPVVEIAPRHGAVLPTGIAHALATRGVSATADKDVLRLELPPVSAPS